MLPMLPGEMALIKQSSPKTLRDTGVRMVYTDQTNADGRPIAPAYPDGATLACRFSWGNDGTDRTRETPENITSTNPHVHVPLGSGFTSRDRFRLTHVYGQAVVPPLVFQVAGAPIDGVLTQVLELTKVSS